MDLRNKGNALLEKLAGWRRLFVFVGIVVFLFCSNGPGSACTTRLVNYRNARRCRLLGNEGFEVIVQWDYRGILMRRLVMTGKPLQLMAKMNECKYRRC